MHELSVGTSLIFYYKNNKNSETISIARKLEVNEYFICDLFECYKDFF